MRLILMLALLAASFAVIAAEKTFDVRIEHRKVVQPGDVIRVVKGDTVTLHWRSDEAVKLHMHGYDVHMDVSANKPAEMHFNANVSGRFPVTSHGFGNDHGDQHGDGQSHDTGTGHGHEALLYIEVYPE
jgi:FtsP/CotA-like multicopper oxidase with cupredoxin domain